MAQAEELKERAWIMLRKFGLEENCTGFEDAVMEFKNMEYNLWDLARYVEENANTYYEEPCKYLAAVVLLYITAYDREVSTQDFYTAEDLRAVEKRLFKFAETRDPSVFNGLYRELDYP
jgi:hypothetical protein